MSLTLPADAELTADALAALAGAPPLHVFRMVARAPASLAPFIQLARSILVGSELSPRLRELAVLRVTHVARPQARRTSGAQRRRRRRGARSSYAFEQHVQLAKLVGITADEIAAVTADPAALDADGRLACAVADEITREVRLSDDTLAAAVARLGQRQATELILVCSYFNMVSRFLESTRVPLDLLGGRS